MTYFMQVLLWPSLFTEKKSGSLTQQQKDMWKQTVGGYFLASSKRQLRSDQSQYTFIKKSGAIQKSPEHPLTLETKVHSQPIDIR